MKLDLRAFRYLVRNSFWSEWWLYFNEHDCWGRAAQLSFYFLLAFFPFLIFLSSLISFIPFEADLLQTLLREMGHLLPASLLLLLGGEIDSTIYRLRREKEWVNF